MTGSSKGRALLLTVGARDLDGVRETPLEPLKMSISPADLTRVVLLPSAISPAPDTVYFTRMNS